MLYIFCGLPFSGKTTLAKELVKRFGFKRIDLDEINNERGLGRHGNYSISNNDWKLTYQESYKRVEEALMQGKTVISDTTNFTLSHRDKLRAIAQKYNTPTYVIYINIPDSVAKYRWQQNKITRERYDVKDKDFSEVADNFQPPSKEENVIVYDQTIPLIEWIQINFRSKI